MADCQRLPIWVSYLRAFAVPVFAAIIALAGVFTGARQMLIADEKLKHDIFYRRYDRRLALYQATRAFLARAFQTDMSDLEEREFGLLALDAQFLFDQELYHYLDEMRFRVSARRRASQRANAHPPGDERKASQKIEQQNLKWLIEQGDGATGLTARFMPYLVEPPVKRPWWLRWP